MPSRILIFKLSLLAAFFVGLLVLLVPVSYYTVSLGTTALHLRFGKVVSVEQEPGFYLKMPGIDSIVFMNMRINKAEIETTAMSRDLQTVSVGMAINYRISDPLKLYQTIGTLYRDVIINPFTQESVKAIVARFTAEDLIQNRHEAKEQVIAELKMRLEPRYLNLVDFNFTHLDFSPEFIKAVEDKQIADQSAKTAKNLTEKVKEEMLQARARAEAEAYALKVKKESVTQELILLQQVETQMRAIEKWDGVLPRVTSGSMPMLSLAEYTK